MNIKSLIFVGFVLCVLGNAAHAAVITTRSCWLENANCCKSKDTYCSDTLCMPGGKGTLCPTEGETSCTLPFQLQCQSATYDGFNGYVLCYDVRCPVESAQWWCADGFYSDGVLETDENGNEIPDCYECDTAGLDNTPAKSDKTVKGVEACYIPAGEMVRDRYGKYKYTADCHYKW